MATTAVSRPTRALALSAYRRLFRARKIAFGHDELAMTESRFAIRAQFELNKQEKNPNEIAIMLKMADEAEDVLLNEVVQGKLNSDGNYAVKLKPEHAESSAKGNFEPVSIETHAGTLEEVEVSTTRKSD